MLNTSSLSLILTIISKSSDGDTGAASDGIESLLFIDSLELPFPVLGENFL